MAKAIGYEAVRRIADRIRAAGPVQGAFGGLMAPPAENGVRQMPFVAHTETVHEFVRFAYDSGLVVDFDWASWRDTDRGRSLCEDPAAMADADEREIRQVITAHIRADRFVEGTLLEAFESGLVLRALDRLAELHSPSSTSA